MIVNIFMKDFEYAHQVLVKTVLDGIPFNVAIQSSLNEKDKKQELKIKSTVFSIAGCVLRHYYVFKEIITRQYENISENDFLLLSLGFANNLFAKCVNKQELNDYIIKKSKLQGAPNFIDCFKDPKKLIPEDIEYGSQKYYSLRYNIPVWVVDMWQNNGGEIVAKKLFHCLTKREENTVRINENLIEPKDFFSKYKDFVPVINEEGCAQFTKEESLKKQKAVIEGDALRFPIAYEYMCRKIEEINPLKGIAIYSCGTNHLLEELCVRLGLDFYADYICGHSGHLLEVKDNIKKFGLTDVDVHEGDYTHIGEFLSGPVQTFFVCPRSSFLLGLYERADQFLRINKEDINRLVKVEYESLLEASRYVKNNGNLIYFTTTFSNSEGRRLIKKFLKENEGFELMCEKQLFPFDKFQTMLYFAVLRKD